MGTTKGIHDYGGGGGKGLQKICDTMRTATVETQEIKIRNIGQENTDGVPLGGTETAASMAPSPSTTE